MICTAMTGVPDEGALPGLHPLHPHVPERAVWTEDGAGRGPA